MDLCTSFFLVKVSGILLMMYFCKFFYCTSESGLYFIQKFDMLRKGDQHKTYVEYFAEVFCGPLRL